MRKNHVFILFIISPIFPRHCLTRFQLSDNDIGFSGEPEKKFSSLC